MNMRARIKKYYSYSAQKGLCATLHLCARMKKLPSKKNFFDFF